MNEDHSDQTCVKFKSSIIIKIPQITLVKINEIDLDQFDINNMADSGQHHKGTVFNRRLNNHSLKTIVWAALIYATKNWFCQVAGLLKRLIETSVV